MSGATDPKQLEQSRKRVGACVIRLVELGQPDMARQMAEIQARLVCSRSPATVQRLERERGLV